MLAGLLELRREELIERRRSIDEFEGADDALREWLRALEDYFSLCGGLAEPLAVAMRERDTENPLVRLCEDLITTTEHYLHAAQREGGVRSGIEGLDLLLAASSVAWIRSTGAADEAPSGGSG